MSVFQGSTPPLMLWLFIASTNLSMSFLHLYSKKLLKILRLVTISGTILMMILLLSNYLNYEALLKSEGWNGKAAVFALGLVLAGFSGIGAKEAFCFKLYEGYAYAILLAITVFIHLFGFLSPNFGLIMAGVCTLLVISFTFRKMVLPFHYDIGDKSKY